MKKLTDKTISILCCIAMVVITCFGVSYKVAHKTYADTTPTTKQTMGMWFASLLASMGARIYITTAQGYEWLVDNFNEVMRMANLTYTLGELVEDAQERYNEQSSTLTLPELPSKAISLFLENLWDNGFRQDSIDFDVGEYEIDVQGTYALIPVGNTYIYTRSNSNIMYYYTSTPCRAVVFKMNSQMNRIVFVLSSQDAILSDNYRASNLVSGGAGASRKWSYTTRTINNVQYGVNYDNVYIDSPQYVAPNIPYVADYVFTTENQMYLDAIALTYGAQAEAEGVQEIQVYGDGTLGLDDMVNTADRDKDVEIDYNDLLGAEAGAKTFAEVMEKIRAILEGEQEGAIPQAEVIVKTIVPVPSDVPIPLIFEGLPEIVKPECENLSACLVSGVQTASQHLQNIYNSNNNVANYTMVSLAIGVALYILTGGI